MRSRSSRSPVSSRALRIAMLLVSVALVGRAAAPGEARALPVRPAVPAPLARPLAVVPAGVPAGAALLEDSIFGRSGKLRARIVSRARSLQIPVLARHFGDSVVGRPGVHALRDSSLTRPLSFITLLPFAEKSGGRIGGYRVGFWPAERRAPRGESYGNPDGFIEVTLENQDTYVSEHFRLRDFLTHDQRNVWPKYIVLREELVDKLELMIDDLNARGVAVRRVVVMSGFRTPQYNQRGVGAGGRAKDSRHQFGDAADVFVDNDGNGRMDDLNRDGRVDHRDAQVLIDAAERVEGVHPDLVGGAGRYRATRAHGPFAHIDVRGQRARWGTA